MKKYLFLLFSICFLSLHAQNSYTINTAGMTFTPDTVTINLGDTVEFGPLGYHNAVEVDESTWTANDTTYNGGFYFALGSPGGYFIADSAKTYYYVCQPHASMEMKGVIIANAIQVPGCTDSLACNYNPTATIDDSSCIFPDGCTDSTATNFNVNASCDDGSCIYPLPYAPIFFSEWAEGSSNNKYFEIFNPTNDTISLANYAFARVNGNPTTPGVYEYWSTFDSGAVILPFDVYIVADQGADSIILNEADMGFGALSNGDDGMALVYGNQPASPISPDSGTYVILDWIGDWNGDPGSGWDVAGVSSATANHTLIRKCSVSQGDTNWILSAGTSPVNSQWIVLANNNWSDIGQHTTSPCIIVYGCTDTIACDYDSSATIDDNSCSYPQTYTQNITICDGDSVIVGSSVYYSAGVYTDSTLTLIGCDSIIETTVSIYSSSIFGGIPNNNIGSGGFYNSLQHLELNCYTPSELVSALIYAQDSNMIVFELRDNNGLVLQDTSYQVTPGVQRIYFNFEIPIATGLQLGISTSNSGLYRTNQDVSYPYTFGNLISLTGSSAGTQYYYFYYDIEIRPSFQNPQTISICDGGTYQVGLSSYTVSGIYTDTLQSIIGCDSISVINLIVLPNSSDSLFYTICSGQSVIIGNSAYDSTGIYVDTLIANNGCDSVVTTSVNVLTSSASNVTNNMTICDGDSFMVGSNVYNLTGTYYDTLQNVNGCDSLITTNLTVQTPIYQDTTICNGDTVFVGTSFYTATGSYTDTLTSLIGGCDSIVHTNLTIYSQFNSIFGGADSASSPGAYSNYNGYLDLNCILPSKLISALVYAGDTNTITFELRDNTGNVLDDTTITVQLGEQRIYFDFNIPVGTDLELGVSAGNTQLFRNNAGQGNSMAYPYNIGGVTITSSNSNSTQYYYFYYNLEIQQTTQPTTYSICDGGSISVAGNIYDSTGFYTDSLTSSIGCDSLVFTNLVVYPNINYTNVKTICSGEITMVGSSVYDSTGIYIDTLYSAFGCDSIVTTTLTVLSISAGVGTNNPIICLGDSVIVGNSTYYNTGIYLDTLSSSNGCDSVVTTTLTTLTANYASIFGGILDTTIGGGGFFSGAQYLELSCYETSSLVSAVVYSEDSTLTTFEIRDDNGNVLKDTSVNLIPGSQRIYFNYEMSAGADYELGVNGSSDNLFRHNAGVNYPYTFASSAAITSSSAGGQYYYFFYDVEITPYMAINTVRICDGESITINGNVYAATGVYTDTYNAFNGCDSIVETHLRVDSAVTAQISQNGVNIEANVNGGTSPYSYIWSSGQTSQSIIPLVNGSYWVIATDTNGCISDTAFYMVTFIPSGVDDILNSDINIYPNPTDGLINIMTDLKIEKIELFSVEGKLLKTTMESSILLNTKGIYFIKVISEKGNIIKRVVVN